jgi:hypothetical protein
VHYLWRAVRDVYHDWLSSMSGIASVVLAACAAMEYFGVPLAVSPQWFWVAALMCLLVAIFRVLVKEYKAHDRVVERLKPRLAILDFTETHDRYYRIRVKNLSAVDCHFGVMLAAIDPPVPGLSLPLHLQITHEPEKTVVVLPGNQDRPVDVFRKYGLGEGLFQLTGAHHQPDAPKRPCKLTIRAHCQEGEPVDRIFVVDPTNDAFDFRVAT